jgi:hypothetical protein
VDEYCILQYFICLYRIKGLVTVKYDSLYKLIFTAIVCSIGNISDNHVSIILQIFNDYLFVLCGHLRERVESRLTSARKDHSCVIFRSKCSVAQKEMKKKQGTANIREIEFFFYSRNFLLYNTKVICRFCLTLDFTNNLSLSFSF